METVAHSWSESSFLEYLKNQKTAAVIFTIDVNAKRFAEWKNGVLNVDPKTLIVPLGKRSRRVRFQERTLGGMGIDRVAAVEGACDWALSEGLEDRPFIVVMVGTATVVDVVSSRREHLGGYIIPGPRICWKVYTGRRKKCRCSLPKSGLGTSSL